MNYDGMHDLQKMPKIVPKTSSLGTILVCTKSWPACAACCTSFRGEIAMILTSLEFVKKICSHLALTVCGEDYQYSCLLAASMICTPSCHTFRKYGAINKQAILAQTRQRSFFAFVNLRYRTIASLKHGNAW